MASHYQPRTGLGRFVHEFEETAIAVILGLMTLITFINVVLRYGFNTGLIWGLEAVTLLFAWLVLLGVSYAVKVTAHLGVDAVINLFDKPARRVLALIAGLVCIISALRRADGQASAAAKALKLPRKTFYDKLARYGIRPEDFRS